MTLDVLLPVLSSCIFYEKAVGSSGGIFLLHRRIDLEYGLFSTKLNAIKKKPLHCL